MSLKKFLEYELNGSWLSTLQICKAILDSVRGLNDERMVGTCTLRASITERVWYRPNFHRGQTLAGLHRVNVLP